MGGGGGEGEGPVHGMPFVKWGGGDLISLQKNAARILFSTLSSGLCKICVGSCSTDLFRVPSGAGRNPL